MINVNVKFTSVEVTNYIRNEPVSLRILFNDGKKDYSISKITNLENINEFASQIKNEVKSIVKNQNSDKGAGMFDGVVTVVFGDIDDEVNITEKLSSTFGRIRDDIRKMKAPNAQGLLQRMASFKGSKYSI